MDELLKISDLTFEYDGKRIFDKLNLQLNYNEWYTLINDGNSGATTLVKMISGLFDNYEGEIEFNFLKSNLENLYEIRTRMSVLFSDLDNQILTDNVYDEITFELDNMNYSEDLKEQFINDIDKYTNIKDILNKSINELSLEEKYVVTLASALIIKPKLLILDNTYTLLNKSLRKRLYDIIRIYKDDNKLTILNITNNLEDSLLGDNIIYLKNGEILFNERTEKVYNEKLLTDDTETMPFMVKLSEYLKLYNLVDKNYYELEELVDVLWK